MFKNPLEIVMGLNLIKKISQVIKKLVRIHVASTHMIQSFDDKKR